MKFLISILLMMAGMEGNQALGTALDGRYGWATAHLLVAVAFTVGGWLFLDHAVKPPEPQKSEPRGLAPWGRF